MKKIINEDSAPAIIVFAVVIGLILFAFFTSNPDVGRTRTDFPHEDQTYVWKNNRCP